MYSNVFESAWSKVPSNLFGTVFEIVPPPSLFHVAFKTANTTPILRLAFPFFVLVDDLISYLAMDYVTRWPCSHAGGGEVSVM